MSADPRRLELDTQLGELYQRVRDLEAKQCGPWIRVADPDNPDAPPYEGTFTGDMQFRWLLDFGVEFQGSYTGGSPGQVVFVLPDDPYYRPNHDLPPFACINQVTLTLAVSQLLANGNFVYLA